MLERAMSVTPEEIVSLHGGLKEVPASDDLQSAPPGAHQMPPIPPGANDNPGEQSVTVGDATFTRGSKVLLAPGTDRDVFDRMLDGREATLERIYIDYDDAVHLAVTVDDDPGQELMRETGRYLFFRPHEVRAL
jgi:hypothetical protein